MPVLTPRLSSYWVDLVTPIPASISRPLIEGLRSEVVCSNDLAQQIFPQIKPLTYDQALERALRVPDLDSDGGAASGGAVCESRKSSMLAQVVEDEGWVADIREGDVDVSPAQVFAVVEGIGGKRGWFYGTFLWRLRAAMDRLLGGSGMGDGRRDPDSLRVGDSLDFWRVEEVVEARRLCLKAMMKVPGEAYLIFETISLGAGKTRLRSSALFRPRGLMGRIYWWMLLPIHKFIFSGMNCRHPQASCSRSARSSVHRRHAIDRIAARRRCMPLHWLQPPLRD